MRGLHSYSLGPIVNAPRPRNPNPHILPEHPAVPAPEEGTSAYPPSAGKLAALAGMMEDAGWCVVAGLPRGLWIGGRAAAALGEAAADCGSWAAFLKISRSLDGMTVLDRHARIAIWAPASSTNLPPTARLTPRELGIQLLLRQGKTGPEIAIITGISKRTVEKHVANLYRKSGIHNRTAAILSQAANTPDGGGR